VDRGSEGGQVMNLIRSEDLIEDPREVPKFDPILRFTPNNTVKNVNKNTIKLLSPIFWPEI